MVTGQWFDDDANAAATSGGAGGASPLPPPMRRSRTSLSEVVNCPMLSASPTPTSRRMSNPLPATPSWAIGGGGGANGVGGGGGGGDNKRRKVARRLEAFITTKPAGCVRAVGGSRWASGTKSFFSCDPFGATATCDEQVPSAVADSLIFKHQTLQPHLHTPPQPPASLRRMGSKMGSRNWRSPTRLSKGWSFNGSSCRGNHGVDIAAAAAAAVARHDAACRAAIESCAGALQGEPDSPFTRHLGQDSLSGRSDCSAPGSCSSPPATRTPGVFDAEVCLLSPIPLSVSSTSTSCGRLKQRHARNRSDAKLRASVTASAARISAEAATERSTTGSERSSGRGSERSASPVKSGRIALRGPRSVKVVSPPRVP